jgi:hypothetical protein
MEMKEFEGMMDLRNLPKTIKMFFTMFIIVMGLGYIAAVTNVGLSEGLTFTDIANHYRGNEALMIEAPGPAELMTHSHTHLLSMSMMMFTLGLIFMFTRSLPAWLKKFVLVDAYVAILIAVSSFWLIRYVAAWMSVFMALSGMLLGISLLFMTFTPLYEMWLRKK